MFGKQKITVAQKIETLIGKETMMRGNIESKGSIRIDGRFQGDITGDSDIIIGEEALVQASVNCSNVILAGRVEGNINAEGKLDIRATGVLIGDATVGSLLVEDGAILFGNCKMTIREDKRISNDVFKGADLLKGENGQETEVQEKQGNKQIDYKEQQRAVKNNYGKS